MAETPTGPVLGGNRLPWRPRRRTALLTVVAMALAAAFVAAAVVLVRGNRSASGGGSQFVARDTPSASLATGEGGPGATGQHTLATGASPGPPGRFYAITATVVIRDGPSTSSTAVGSIPAGASVAVQCKSLGETIQGPYGPDMFWDKVRFGGITGFVTDEFVDTKQDEADNSLVPVC